MSFFSIDSPLMQGLNKIINCAYLSLLWLIFSIPLVTIGASTTALYYTTNKVIRNNRGYVFQQFWHSFKTSFKQSTIIWLIYVVIALVLYYDGEIMLVLTENSGFGTTANLFFKAMLILISTWLVYVLAYIARFEAPLKTIAKNAAFMAIRHLPKTLLIMLIFAVVAFAVWFMPILIIIMPTLGAWIISYFMEKTFAQYMSDEDRQKEAKLNGKEYE